MDDRISELNSTLERLERLLLRLEVDMATGLFGADYQAAIARLAEESKRQRAELTREPSMPDGTREADDSTPIQGSSRTHSVSFTRSRSAGTGSTETGGS